MLGNSSDRWGTVSRGLHWLTAALIVAVAAIGLWMDTLPRAPRTIEIYALHKSLGLTILALAAVRLAWRLAAGAPAPVPGLPRWQRRAAEASHALLYALMFAMPLSGWLLNTAAGYPLQWFGLFNLPRIVGRDEGLHALAGSLHEYGFWALLVLVAVHASAAFYHHLFRDDDTLRRMLPGARRVPEGDRP